MSTDTTPNTPRKSAHALILNRLHQMQLAPRYATAREELNLAETTIVQLESERESLLAERDALKSALEQLRDEADQCNSRELRIVIRDIVRAALAQGRDKPLDR